MKTVKRLNNFLQISSFEAENMVEFVEFRYTDQSTKKDLASL